jgi:hypothetical protein
MVEDKKTIGLTDSGKATMEQMVEVVGFKRDMDAAKFAFAFAVEQGCEPGPIEGTGTIWNVGTLDEGGDLKALIQNLYPQTQFPYRALESLMDAGFGLLAKEMTSDSGLRIEHILQRATDAAKGSQPG